MSKIVYLMGAGASAKALPVINQISDSITNLIKLLQKKENQLDDVRLYKDYTKLDCQKEFIKDLQWLRANSKNHQSVDTFAKKLFLIQDFNNLNRLKITLSTLLTFEHELNPPDERYDAFFASLQEKLYEFPTNLRILSWNYDNQFEQSFANYSGQGIIEDNKYRLNVNEKNAYNTNKSGFGIYKLNGSIGFSSLRSMSTFSHEFEQDGSIKKPFLEEIISNYMKKRNDQDYAHTLSFAWEQDIDSDSFFESLRNEIMDMEVLVVIGYSFPFFNREIDRKLFKDWRHLKKVYFQDKYPETIKERFQAIRDDIEDKNLICKKDLDQFLIPNEL